MPRKPAAAPIYLIDDVVYLRASAAIGFLESYKISNIQFNSGRNSWIYVIGLNYNVTGAPITIGDNITLKGGSHEDKILYFTENELINFCEAAAMVESVLENRLARIREQIATRCGGT